MVRMKNCVSYPLPQPFAEGELVNVVARDIGAVIVERDGRHYRVPLTNVDPGSDRQLDCVWLDQWDRRVRKVEARLEAMRQRSETSLDQRKLRRARSASEAR